MLRFFLIYLRVKQKFFSKLCLPLYVSIKKQIIIFLDLFLLVLTFLLTHHKSLASNILCCFLFFPIFKLKSYAAYNGGSITINTNNSCKVVFLKFYSLYFCYDDKKNCNSLLIFPVLLNTKKIQNICVCIYIYI